MAGLSGVRWSTCLPAGLATAGPCCSSAGTANPKPDTKAVYGCHAVPAQCYNPTSC